MRHHHQPTLINALLRPLCHRDFLCIAQRGFRRTTRTQRMNHKPRITQQRNMPEHLHAILGANAHEKLPIPTKIPCAKSRLPIKIRHIAEHFTPLARQQIHHIHTLALAFQKRRLRTQKMHMRIGSHPPLFPPLEHAVNFKSNHISIGTNRELLADRRNLISLLNIGIHIAQRQICHAFPRDITILIQPIDVFAVIVLKPVRVHLAMIPLRRQIFPSLTVHVQPHSNRRLRPFLHHANCDRTMCGSHLHDLLCICQIVSLRLSISFHTHVKPRLRMCDILDNHRRRRPLGLHIYLCTQPAFRIVIQHRPRRHHHAQINIYILKLAIPVQLRALGQFQLQFLAHTRSQRMIFDLRMRYPQHQRPLLPGNQCQMPNRFLRMGIGQRINPQFYAPAISPRTVPRLSATISRSRTTPQTVFIRRTHHNPWFGRRHRCKRTCPPPNTGLLNRKPAQNARRLGLSTFIRQHVIRHVITQFIAIHSKIGQLLLVITHAIFNPVQKHHIARLHTAHINAHSIAVEQYPIGFAWRAQIKWHSQNRLQTIHRAQILATKPIQLHAIHIVIFRQRNRRKMFRWGNIHSTPRLKEIPLILHHNLKFFSRLLHLFHR